MPASSLVLGCFFIQSIGQQELLSLTYQQHASPFYIIVKPPTQIRTILGLRNEKGIQFLFSYPSTKLTDGFLAHIVPSVSELYIMRLKFFCRPCCVDNSLLASCICSCNYTTWSKARKTGNQNYCTS